MGGGLKSNDFCLSSVARRGGWPGTGTHKVAAAFGAAAALISIGKSCGLQDLRPIVNVEGGSSSVVLPPLRHPNAEATDEERPRLGDESQRSMCRNPRLLMRSFLRRERG